MSEIMDLSTFRKSLYDSVFLKRKRALLSLVDGILLTGGGNPTVASLASTLSYGALYQGLELGEIDDRALTELMLQVGANLPRLYAIDATVVEKPKSSTSPDRVRLHKPGPTHGSSRPEAGWSYQMVARLTEDSDSWVLPTHVTRLSSDDDITDVTLAQINLITSLSGATRDDPDIFLLDSKYKAAAITYFLRRDNIPAEIIVRLATSQVFYATSEKPPPGMRRRGGPKLHNAKLSLKKLIGKDKTSPALLDDATPDGGLHLPNEQFGYTDLDVYHNFHPMISPVDLGCAPRSRIVVSGDVLVIKVQHLKRKGGQASMAVWASAHLDKLLETLKNYLKRYEIEHNFRFLKSILQLTSYKSELPEHFTRFFQLLMISMAHLYLNRNFHIRRPWESKKRLEKHHPTPQQVLRGISVALVTVFKPPKGPDNHPGGPGRPDGSKSIKRKRFRVLDAEDIYYLKCARREHAAENAAKLVSH